MGKKFLSYEIAPLNRSKLTTLFRSNVTKNTRSNIISSCSHYCCCCFRFCANFFLILVNFHTKVNDFIPVKLHNEIVGPIPNFAHSKICCFPSTNNIFTKFLNLLFPLLRFRIVFFNDNTHDKLLFVTEHAYFFDNIYNIRLDYRCLLYTSPSPRDS